MCKNILKWEVLFGGVEEKEVENEH